MAKLWPRLSSSEFKRARENSKPYFGKFLVLLVSPLYERRVAFIASKKIGKAHDRNFLKRFIRGEFLKIEEHLDNGFSYIFIIKKEMLQIQNSFSTKEEVKSEVLSLLKNFLK